MRFGHFISFLAHGALLWTLYVGAPELFQRPEISPFIPFEMISEAELAEFTNVPDTPEEATPASSPEPEVEAEEPEPEPEPEVLPEAEEPEPAPAPTEEREAAPAPPVEASEPEPTPSPGAKEWVPRKV